VLSSHLIAGTFSDLHIGQYRRILGLISTAFLFSVKTYTMGRSNWPNTQHLNEYTRVFFKRLFFCWPASRLLFFPFFFRVSLLSNFQRRSQSFALLFCQSLALLSCMDFVSVFSLVLSLHLLVSEAQTREARSEFSSTVTTRVQERWLRRNCSHHRAIVQDAEDHMRLIHHVRVKIPH